MKKIFSVLLIAVLTLSSLFTASSGVLAKPNDAFKEPDFLQTKDTKEHKVYQFSNGEKLEKFDKEGREYFVADTGEEKVEIYKEGESVFVVDLETKEVLHEATLETETISTENTDSSLVPEYYEGTSSDFGIGTQAVATDPGGSSKYKFVHTRNLSLEVFTTSASVLAGVIASFVGTPITGAITTIAGGAISLALPKIYWKRHMYQYTENIYRYTRWINQSYKYHDYTGYMGAAYAYTKTRVGIH